MGSNDFGPSIFLLMCKANKYIVLEASYILSHCHCSLCNGMTSNGWGNMCPYSKLHRCVRPQKLLCPSRKSGHKTPTYLHDVLKYVLRSFWTNRNDIRKIPSSDYLSTNHDCRHGIYHKHNIHVESCLRFCQMFGFLFLSSTQVVTRSDIHLRSRPSPFMATIQSISMHSLGSDFVSRAGPL